SRWRGTITSVAPRARRPSTTKLPKNPAPPVTRTRLFAQKLTNPALTSISRVSPARGSVIPPRPARVMRVLFDHQIFSYQRFGGASRYYHELINVFHATPGVEVALGVAASPNEYLAHAAYYRGRVTQAGGAGRFLATYARNELATRWAARLPHDVLHTTFYDPLAARHRGTLVVTV